MKIKYRKSLYFFIPLGLLIKVVITIILLNLPGGCREENDKKLFEKEAGNITALSVTAELSE